MHTWPLSRGADSVNVLSGGRWGVNMDVQMPCRANFN